MLQIAKFFGLAGSILSLYVLLGRAFFIPGGGWEDRLISGLATLGLAASVCFATGLLFEIPNRKFDPEPVPSLLHTLPVRLFFWGASLVALMFLLSWFLANYFVPLIWKNQPY
ncbi:MAG TPA: hypothetical protein VHX13_07800 [Acidobacteriaceae bacterium]|jgi:hypothetical protein|nr:hypothetical protein [Acidobacteriaceae bacterium]